ncbi:MAG TPA: hypothetical protein VM283_00555, partial [Armatimonadota bacterium]|nr:hypothetical protein [Armatimonadota bacterium]
PPRSTRSTWAIATRRRMRGAAGALPGAAQRRPAPTPPADDSARREQLLVALTETPDAPPQSTTVLEERQIGDLAELPPGADEGAQADHRWELVLPLLEDGSGGGAHPEPPAAEPVAPPAGAPPGDGAAPTGDAAAPTGDDAPPQPAAEPEPGPDAPAEATPPPAEPPVQARPAPDQPAPDPQPVDDTARLDPVTPATPGSLQRMVDVVAARAGEAEVQMRVWRTADHRTILAAVPPGAQAREAAALAERVVRGYLALSRWLGQPPTWSLIARTEGGAWALRSLDQSAAVLLMIAGGGEEATVRLPVVLVEVADALGDIPDLSVAGPLPPEGTGADELAPDDALALALAEATGLDPSLPPQWSSWRDPDGAWVALAAPEGTDPAGLAAHLALAVPAAAGLALALDLGELLWLALPGRSSTVTACPAASGGQAGVIAALTAAEPGPAHVAAALVRVVEEARL